jgi:ATP-dependent Clp protease ATP-binding subunit ClpA
LAIKKIVVKFVDELKVSLANKNIRLNLSEGVIDMLADKGYDSKMGARPLSRKIDESIRVPLSKKILFEGLENCTVQGNMIQDQVEFVVDNVAAVPMIDEQGYIVLDKPQI